MERAGSFAWTNRSWRVREEFVRTVAAAVGLFASTELPLLRALLPNVSGKPQFIWNIFKLRAFCDCCNVCMICAFQILHLLNDSNQSVRDAAMSCIEVSNLIFD